MPTYRRTQRPQAPRPQDRGHSQARTRHRLVAALTGGVAVGVAALTLSACGARTAARGVLDGPGPAAIGTISSAPSAAVATHGPNAAKVAAENPPSARPPAPNACAHNTHGQWVLVDISEQHLWMCARHRLVKDTAVTTGMAGPDTATPTGHFTIQGLDRNSVLTLNTGATYDVKYWIPFSAPLYGFHDASWQTFPFGSPRYRTDGSHGCVHMPLRAIKFLYGWAHIGAAVTIRA